jgi:outer membrane protein TolC
VFEREQLQRQVAADLNASYAAVQTLTEQLALMRDSLLRRAEEARRIAEAAYREGAASLVQVLDAARALAEARQVYHRALFARQQSLLELNAAIGTDDEPMPSRRENNR